MSKWMWILVILLMTGCAEKGSQALTVCCAGDSLMRPIPTHLRKLLPSAGSEIHLRDWARGGLSSQTYMSFFRKRVKRRKRYPFDYILLQLGTNDIRYLYSGEYSLNRFEANVKKIIDEFMEFSQKGNNPVKFSWQASLRCMYLSPKR